MLFVIGIEGTERLLTGGADSAVRLWDVRVGKVLYKWDLPVSVLCARLAYGDDRFLVLTSNIMGRNSTVRVGSLTQDLRVFGFIFLDGELVEVFQMKTRDDKISNAIWGYMNESIIASHSDGSISIFDPEVCFLG